MLFLQCSSKTLTANKVFIANMASIHPTYAITIRRKTNWARLFNSFFGLFFNNWLFNYFGHIIYN